jgi:hypothetical protein
MTRMMPIPRTSGNGGDVRSAGGKAGRHPPGDHRDETRAPTGRSRGRSPRPTLAIRRFVCHTHPVALPGASICCANPIWALQEMRLICLKVRLR